MISNNILEFLKALKNNNNRNWFAENKKWYQSSREEFEVYVNFLIGEIQQFDNDIRLLTAKDCIFRIYRDTRFSRDKSPYKTNFGAFFVKEGRKSGNAGYYLHIEPGNCFLAGGIYMPSSYVLKIIRREIYENIEEFKSIITDEEFIYHFKEISGEKLKASPHGYSGDFSEMELLKHKSYTAIKSIPDNFIQKKNFNEEVIRVFKAIYPLNNFINLAIAGNYY
jgi:uncharacterized protein (TIGR02453 family)